MTDAWRRRRRLGESDCEEIRSGFIAQPVNALSSVAYVAGGGWVVARGAHAGRPAAVAFGGLLGAVGAGSVLYHGPCPPGAQQAHDASLAAALGLVVLHNTAAISGRHHLVRGAVQAAAAIAAAVPVLPTRPLHQSGRRGPGHRRRDHGSALCPQPPPSRTGGSCGRAPSPSARSINVLSRTGGPLCRPKSLIQGHAVWHVLSAVSLAAWARGALLPAA